MRLLQKPHKEKAYPLISSPNLQIAVVSGNLHEEISGGFNFDSYWWDIAFALHEPQIEHS
jgi:hypothetical protein